MQISEVILVDDEGRETGIMEKLEAHHKGALHRAFSVFIVDTQGRMLLHKRAAHKYHSPDLWTNACCSHPKPGESILEAANRRLQEEMGFSCALHEFDFIKYFAKFDNGLIEHEYDHLLLGEYDGPVQPDPEEVSDYRFFTLQELDEQLKANPLQFTFWFRLAYPLAKEHLRANKHGQILV
ncbi:MAG TPA: isopentenyl-diphosphate Delta-isomerase [Sphingobacteriaceae bacterium]